MTHNIVCKNLVDDNNTPQPFANSELRAEIAKGALDGVVQAVNFGHLSAIGAADPPVDLWEGGLITPTYPGFPDETETMEISSTSINDTAGGSGTRSVMIMGLLDENGIEMPPVIVDLDGTNWVSLGVQTYNRAGVIRSYTVGVTGSNEGTITLRHTTTTVNVFDIIPIGHTISSSMIYTVPAGKTLYVQRGFIALSRATGASGSANCLINLRQNYPDAPFAPERDIEITHASPYRFENGGFFVFPSRSDLKVTVQAVSDNGTTIAAEYDGFLADN